MKYVVDNIGVDAGIIIVMDMDYLKSVKHSKKDLGRLGKVIDVPKGKYDVTWRIEECWNGEITGKEDFCVTSGKVVVIDPCYVIGKPAKNHDKDWSNWLDTTNFGEELNSDQAFVINQMGGDGVYEVELNFKELK